MPSESETTNTDEKFAIRKLMRLQDGTVGTFFVDALTGELLENLEGYTVVSAGNLEELSTTEETGEQSGDTGDKKNLANYNSGASSGGSSGPRYNAPALKPYPADTFPKAPKAPASAKSTVKNTTPVVEHGPRLDAYETGYGTNEEYYRAQAEREAALKPVSSLEDYKTGYGNPYVSPESSQAQKTDTSYTAPKGAPVDTSYQQNETKTRNGPVGESVLGIASVAAANAGLTASITSGGQTHERDPNMKDQPGGWTGSTAHNIDPETGVANTADISFLNPNGTPATQEQMAGILADMSRMGITGTGYGENYMGVNTAHVDQGRSRSWGESIKDGKGNIIGYAPIDLTPTQQKLVDKAKEDYVKMGSVVPADKPAAPTTLVADGTSTRTNDGRTRSSSISLDNPGDPGKQTVAKNIIEGVGIPDNRDLFTDDLTPAEVSSYGLGRTPSGAEITDMARTFAGELAPSTLTGIVNGDPTALAELASMVSSYENRMNSSNNEGVTRGSQYNSNMPENAAVTDYNNGLFGQALQDQVSGFYGGELAGLGNTAATHYYNPNVSSPSWAGLMVDPTTYDSPHAFGSLSRGDIYTTPNEDFRSYMASDSYYDKAMGVAVDRINDQASLGGMDNSSLLNSSPFDGGYSGDSGGGQFDNSGGYTSVPSGNSYTYGTSSVNDIMSSLGGDGSGQFDSSGQSSGSSTGGYTGGSTGGSSGSAGGSWGQGAGTSTSSSSSGNSFGSGSTASTGGGTDDYFSGW